VAEQLHVGILGCGDAGGEHARAYSALGDEGVRVIAVGVLKVDRARAFVREYASGAQAFDSLTAMLRGVALDAISVCVPNNAHHAATMEALGEGKHVLCEKPPAMTAEEAGEMASAAARAGRVLTYGLVYRHLVAPVAEFVEDVGEIYDARAIWKRRRGIPGWGIYGSLALQGGGAMTDIGVHLLDAAWTLMGRPEPRLVSGRFWRHKALTSTVGLLGPWLADRFEVEDHASAVIDFDAARLQVEAAFAADIAEVEVARLELQGVRGSIVLPLSTTQEQPDPRCVPVIFSERRDRLITSTLDLPLPWTVQTGYRKEVEHFVACCRGEGKALVTPEDGVVVQRMLAGISQSAERGGVQIKL
jgi:predicted dehydrogenase